ncbi:MAG: FUSC family protein [Bacteroidota bacterium]
MEPQEFTNLNDQELLKVAKEMKPTKIYDSFIVGLLVGVAIYSSVKNGLGLLTFVPLVYVPIAGKNNAKRAKIAALLKERNLSIESRE